MEQITMLALLRRLQQQVNDVSKMVGPEGARGPQGPTGPAGDTGADGVQGVRGPAGERGSDGQHGAQGPAGEEGEDGRGVESVSQAADGDLIFHMTDGTEEIIEFPMGLLGRSEGDTVIIQQHHNNTSSTGLIEGTGEDPVESPTPVEQVTWIDGGIVAIHAQIHDIDAGDATSDYPHLAGIDGKLRGVY